MYYIFCTVSNFPLAAMVDKVVPVPAAYAVATATAVANALLPTNTVQFAW